MKIKWSIVLLALFGLVAAAAAAVLTASLSAQQIQAAQPELEPETTILVAAADIKAMNTVKAEDVVEKTVKVSHAPEGHFSEPAQIIGKTLSLPIVKGQTFTYNDFPTDGHGLLLATQLPKGKRAVTVALSDHSALQGLLYPGSVVDVVASFRVDSGTRIGKAVSTTLLQNVQVLGVEDNSVVKQASAEEASKRSSRSSTRRELLVTLMVDSRQAEALQLAMEHGEISLAMRNPSDDDTAISDATLLSEGKLAQLAQLLAPKVANPERPSEESESNDRYIGESAAPAASGSAPLEALEPASQQTESKSAEPVKARQKYYNVDVIRGLSSETRSFPVAN